MERIFRIGRHFKTSVLSYELNQQLADKPGGFTTEVEFMSHRESEKKGKGAKKAAVTV